MRPTFRQMSIICMVVVFLLPFAAGAQENSSQPAEDDWPMVNYDIVMSRNSPQTAITKDNVDQLQMKWIFNSMFIIENPPLIVNDTAYIENNAMQVLIVSGISCKII